MSSVTNREDWFQSLSGTGSGSHLLSECDCDRDCDRPRVLVLVLTCIYRSSYPTVTTHPRAHHVIPATLLTPNLTSYPTPLCSSVFFLPFCIPIYIFFDMYIFGTRFTTDPLQARRDPASAYNLQSERNLNYTV